MLERFKQKRVLITGAASGLGKELVNQFACLGWKIALVDINLDGAQQVADAIGEEGGEARAFYCNIAEDKDFQLIADQLRSLWGGVDIIINNAGIASCGWMDELTMEEWLRVLNLNTHGVFRGCHFWLPLLPPKGPAHIVNTASFAGIAQAPGMLTYNVSKASVIALSESLRVELGYRDCGVSVACPAFFKTNLLDSMQQADENTLRRVQSWMDNAKVTAEQVAADILQAIDKNRFMVISHDYARKAYRFKRWFPNAYLNRVMAKANQLMAKREI